MLSKRIKRVTAIVLGATMLFAQSIPAFAADPTTTAGSGQILDYKIQTQVVPTAMKVAINPNGYVVNLRYTKLASNAEYSSSTKYYSKSGETYSVVTDISDANWSTKLAAGLYTASISNDQIITFNYGLANKSTVARKISINLAVEADDAISFVDTAAKATNEAATDDGGAKKGEYKIFLQLVPAKAGETPTTNTYAKATSYAANTDYYKISSGKYVKDESITSESAFKTATDQLYVATTTIGTEIKAEELADITMEKSTAPITFTAGTGSTSADVAYSLPAATYTLKAGEYLEIGQTYNDLSSKFEMTAIGGLGGFTLTGRMNTNTEWSQLENNTITITPTYRFEDATGLETAVTTGLNQVEAAARTYTVTYNANYTDADPATKTESVAVNGHPTGTNMTFTREGFTQDGWLDAAEGDAVDLNDISEATTLYANWVQDLEELDGYALWGGNDAGVFYVGSSSSTGFNLGSSSVTSVKVNGQDVEYDVVTADSGKWVSVTPSAIEAVGEDNDWASGTELEFEVVFGNNKYSATYTQP